MKILLSYWLWSGLLSVCLLACQPHSSNELYIGVSADYPPFEYQQGGQLVGFDIDLGQALGDAMGRSVVWREMSFSSLIPALQSKQIDIIISSLTATALRKHHVAFSRVYFTSRPVLLSKQAEISQWTDLRLGVQLGSTMEQIAKQQVYLQQASVVALPSNNQILEEMKANRLDGIILEQAQADEFLKHYPMFHVHLIDGPTDLQADMGYAMAFRLNDPLREQVDQLLDQFEQIGTIQALKQKWFGRHDAL